MNLPTISISPTERRRAAEFAELLEDSRPAAGHELEALVTLTAALQPAPFAPRPEFRSALRESLIAQAAARPVLAAAPMGPPRRRQRLRTAAAGVVVVSLVGGVGVAAASTHALPGDPLYGLKRGIESAQLRFAQSDLARGRELLDQADHRLSEAEDLAASEHARSPSTSARIATAITDLGTATRAGAKEFEAAYAESGDGATLVELQRFVVDQRARLSDLSDLLSPSLRGLLGPLSAQLVALQTRLDTLAGPASAAPRSTAPTGGTGVSDPLAEPSGVVTDTIDGATGGSTAGRGGGATGGLGKGAAATLPSAVPRVSLPASPVPSIPAPTAPVPGVTGPSLPVPSVPGIPAPSVSVPSISAPSIPAPAPISTPTLPVAPPTCVAVPPLTSC